MLPPDRSVTSSIRPSTWAGTPEIIVSGAGPNRDTGQFLRTNWWFAPMPPDVIRTAGARLRGHRTAATGRTGCTRAKGVRWFAFDDPELPHSGHLRRRGC